MKAKRLELSSSNDKVIAAFDNVIIKDLGNFYKLVRDGFKASGGKFIEVAFGKNLKLIEKKQKVTNL